MIRVVHLFPYTTPGGAERVVVHLLSHLDRRKFDVSGICLARPSGSDLEKILANARIPVQYLGKGPGFDSRTFSKLYRAIRAAAPDVVHTHAHVMRYLIPYIVSSRFHRSRPAMFHTVHSLAEYEIEPRARPIQRLAFQCGMRPVAVAQEVSVSLDRVYGIKDSLVIPNCLPVAVYRQPKVQRDEWRARENFRPDDFLFVCVAGLRPEKNHPLLLKAFAQFAKRHSRAHLVLAGGGSDVNLKEQAAQLGITSQIRFLGVRTDVPDILGSSDAFVLASFYEGNPLCIMEAMSAGLPVIAPQVGGIPELVSSSVEGLLVPPGSASEMAAAMEQVLLQPELRSSLGAAGAHKAMQRFDISVMVEAYEQLYESSVARSHSVNGSVSPSQPAKHITMRE